MNIHASPTRAPSRSRLRRSVALASAAALAVVTLAAAPGRQPVHAAMRAADDRGAATASGGSSVLAAPTDATIALSLRASSLNMPVFIGSARDGTGRMFIVEQVGKIKILSNGTVFATPFLNIKDQVSNGFEQGLLGLAFHPNYGSNRKLYVNYTNRKGNTRIVEYRASSSNPNRVDTSTKRTILKVNQPYANHNGGMLAFGPDGYLYIGLGDGGNSGSAGDPGNRAQSKSTLLGKILRINVNASSSGNNYSNPGSNPFVGKPGLNEIWQYGLRNPWRFSFDRTTNNLWIGDVGHHEWEEVDRATNTASGPGKGINWGWRVLEGRHCYNPSSGCSTSGKTGPISEYDHSGGRCAITGGYVYRGSAIPELVGGYVFADYCTGEIWVINASAGSFVSPTLLLDTNLQISSFGESAGGELYVVDLGGKVYSVVQG